MCGVRRHRPGCCVLVCEFLGIGMLIAPRSLNRGPRLTDCRHISPGQPRTPEDGNTDTPSADVMRELLQAEYQAALYNLSRVTANGKPARDPFSSVSPAVAALMSHDVQQPEIVLEYRRAAITLARAYLNPSESFLMVTM